MAKTLANLTTVHIAICVIKGATSTNASKLESSAIDQGTMFVPQLSLAMFQTFSKFSTIHVSVNINDHSKPVPGAV